MDTSPSFSHSNTFLRTIRPFITVTFTFVLFFHNPVLGHTPHALGQDLTHQNLQHLTGRELMQQGHASFTQGSFGKAASRWMDAASLYEGQGNKKEQSQALTKMAWALQNIGQLHKAALTLKQAMELVHPDTDPTQYGTILGRLGTLHFALGQEDRAIQLLQEGLALARQADNALLVAQLLNNLGNVFLAHGRTHEAIGTYSESWNLAVESGDLLLAATALTNEGLAGIEEGHLPEGKQRLDMAYDWLASLPDSHQKTNGFLTIGLGYTTIRTHLRLPSLPEEAPARSQLGTRGVDLLPSGKAAQEIPQSPGPHSLEEPPPPSRAEGSFPLPNSDVGKPHPPLTEPGLTLAAWTAFQAGIQAARGAEDTRSESYGWGLLAHLYEEDRRFAEALDLTRRALALAQKVSAPESLYKWHWQIGRILRAMGREEKSVSAYRRALVTLQPIRHEMLGHHRGRLQSFRTTVGPLFFELADLLLQRAAGASTAQAYTSALIQARETVESFKTAELQDYLGEECVIAARQENLDFVSDTTVVIYPIILPDRLELLVSFPSGLKRFPVLVNEDQVARVARAFRTSLQDPGSENVLSYAHTLYAWLVKPLESDLAKLDIDTLVFVPDGVLRTIPPAALHDGEEYLIQKYALAVTPGLSLTDPHPLNRDAIRVFSMGLTKAIGQFPPLPYVKSELDNINRLYKGTVLLDDTFILPTIEKELSKDAFTILHIASHALVQHNIEDSFILAYDQKITMDKLAQLVGLYQHHDHPLDLITLSACETAAGDDQAALGLAGVAIKAGARAALATLWRIDDATTSKLVSEFYARLKRPNTSKAVALQQAQLTILRDPAHQHPNYWAPFLLINNWL